MTSSAPILHFVRCPKCFKVLVELPGTSLYKCGGCGVILQGKAHSSSVDTLSLASAANSSKNLSYNGSLHDKNFSGNQTPPALDHSGGHDQVVKESLKVSGTNDEINSKDEFAENAMKISAESESKFDSLKVEKKFQVYDQNVVDSLAGNHPEQGIPATAENSLNEKGKKNSVQEISKASESLRSSEKLKESSESREQYITSEDDYKAHGKNRNNTSFLMRSISSRAYDGSISSTDKVIARYDFPAREQGFSFASEDFHSAVNFMEPRNHATSKSQPQDVKQFVKSGYSEKNDQAKILKKVDELRNELRGFFNRAADVKGASRLSKSAHFERQFSPNQYQSSFVPPLKQPTSSWLHSRPEDIYCHNEHCGNCSRNACCHLPEGGTLSRPLHMKHSPHFHHEPHTHKSNVKRSQEVKRHCRPVSGGAPFVICYRCYNLLQLPADFLVSTKMYHNLRCGSCSEVLRYSFRPKTRSMTWSPPEAQLPPTEDEKNSNEILDDVITSQDFKFIREGEPVSYSEDIDSFLGKSNSFEADPSRHLVRNYGTVVEEDHGSKKKRSSQLHKLMGYNSARNLLFETLSPVEWQRTEQDR